MRIGLSNEIMDLLKDAASRVFALPPCQIPGCRKHAISQKFRCETCRRHLCLKHGMLRVPTAVPTDAPIVCVSCIIDENPELFEEDAP